MAKSIYDKIVSKNFAYNLVNETFGEILSIGKEEFPIQYFHKIVDFNDYDNHLYGMANPFEQSITIYFSNIITDNYASIAHDIRSLKSMIAAVIIHELFHVHQYVPERYHYTNIDPYGNCMKNLEEQVTFKTIEFIIAHYDELRKVCYVKDENTIVFLIANSIIDAFPELKNRYADYSKTKFNRAYLSAVMGYLWDKLKLPSPEYSNNNYTFKTRYKNASDLFQYFQYLSGIYLSDLSVDTETITTYELKQWLKNNKTIIFRYSVPWLKRMRQITIKKNGKFLPFSKFVRLLYQNKFYESSVDYKRFYVTFRASFGEKGKIMLRYNSEEREFNMHETNHQSNEQLEIKFKLIRCNNPSIDIAADYYLNNVMPDLCDKKDSNVDLQK